VRRPGLRPKSEWTGRLILAVGLAAAFLLCFIPVLNPDLPWHLAAGKQIVATRAIPRTDFLSWTQAGRPWLDFEWGAQLVFYGLERLGGLRAIWLFKSFAFFGLTLFLLAFLRLWRLPDVWIGLAAPAFMIALFPDSDARPEVFSLLLFMLQFYALEKRRLGQWRAPRPVWLAAHAALYAVWANFHAGFAVGLALCGLYGLGALWRGRDAEAAEPLLFAAAGAAGTCLNPYGPRLYEVFWEHWKHLDALHRIIKEWSAPNFFNPFQRGYWALVVFSYAGLLLAVARGRDLPAEHLAAIVFFGLLSSRAFRTTGFSTLVVFPLSLAAWRRLDSPGWWRRARPWALALASALVVWRTVPALREIGLFRRSGRLDDLGPARACAVLRAEKATLSGLRLYNPYDWGGYLDDVLYPDYRVFIDGRYLFAGLLARIDSIKDDPIRWKRLMDEEDIGVALLINNGHVVRWRNVIFWRAFDALAYPPDEWALIYWDSRALILVRRDKVPAEWLEPREFRLIRPHDLRNLGLLVVSGQVALKDVAAEIARYHREIGDPKQDLILDAWFSEFKRGLGKDGGA